MLKKLFLIFTIILGMGGTVHAVPKYDLLLKQLFEGSEDEIKYATTYLNGVYDGVLTSEWVTEFGIGKEAVKICIKDGEYPSIIEVIFMMQDYRADKKNWDRLDNSKIEAFEYLYQDPTYIMVNTLVNNFPCKNKVE
jgi:hypothetical protein